LEQDICTTFTHRKPIRLPPFYPVCFKNIWVTSERLAPLRYAIVAGAVLFQLVGMAVLIVCVWLKVDTRLRVLLSERYQQVRLGGNAICEFG
jgi:hypothetical protein